jgi:pyruvate-ferredoxin/flavodoxin oxidoreductase
MGDGRRAAGDGRRATGDNGAAAANGTSVQTIESIPLPSEKQILRFAQDDNGKGVAQDDNGKGAAQDDNGKGAPSHAASRPSAVAETTTIESTTDLSIEPYIDSARCTSCNECTNLNGKMFAYNASKQATIKDPRAGTFQQLVLAAERCPVGIIHPGTPLNPKEKDLAKWVKRAEPFN